MHQLSSHFAIDEMVRPTNCVCEARRWLLSCLARRAERSTEMVTFRQKTDHPILFDRTIHPAERPAVHTYCETRLMHGRRPLGSEEPQLCSARRPCRRRQRPTLYSFFLSFFLAVFLCFFLSFIPILFSVFFIFVFYLACSLVINLCKRR